MQLVALTLDMTAADLVVAYVLIERVVLRCASAIRLFTIRPFILTACVLAVKLAHDKAITTRMCYDRLHGVFCALTMQGLTSYESQLLLILDFEIPSGRLYQNFANELFAAARPAC